MVMRTIEIKELVFEVGPEQQHRVIQRIKELYPMLDVEVKGNAVSVRGDLRNYKRRSNLIYILTGGQHGKSIPAS